MAVQCPTVLVERWSAALSSPSRYAGQRPSCVDIAPRVFSLPSTLNSEAKSMPRYPTPKIPPSCENISIELAMRVLADTWGNISKAADVLGVPSRDFRYWVRMTPALTAVVDEVTEIFCDKAEAILREALESENDLRRDVASRFVLNGKGATRGWARNLQPTLTIAQPPREIVIRWLDPDEKASDDEPTLIDARPVEGDGPSPE
jgi:hypothetical protein